MDWFLLFGLGFGTGLSGAMIPGPVFLYTVSQAFHEGQAAGVKIGIGHLLLEALFTVVIILGLREQLARVSFRSAVTWLGGAGLIVMGGLILCRLKRFSLVREAHVQFRWGAVAGGGFFSLVSPGFLLWWATIGAAVLLRGALAGGMLGAGMVIAGHAAADLAWHWFLAFSVERGRPYCSDQAYRAVMAAIACCLIGIGALSVRQAMGSRALDVRVSGARGVQPVRDMLSCFRETTATG